MTDQPRDDQFDRLLQGFLAWQAEDLVAPPTAADVAMRIGSRTGIGGRRARVAPVDSTPPPRIFLGRTWRMPTVPSAFARLAMSAVAVAAIVVAGLALMRPSVIGPGAPASPTPSTTLQPSASAGFSRFDSPLHGLSIDYPSGWQIRPATEPWTGGALDFESPAADVIFDPALEGRVYFALASLPRADIIVNRPPDEGPFSGNESDLMQRAGMPCDGGGGGSFTVDGFRAFDFQCRGPGSVGIFTPTRGYVIKLVVEEAGLLETYDLPSFGAMLETVDLRPEEASDAP